MIALTTLIVIIVVVFVAQSLHDQAVERNIRARLDRHDREIVKLTRMLEGYYSSERRRRRD